MRARIGLGSLVVVALVVVIVVVLASRDGGGSTAKNEPTGVASPVALTEAGQDGSPRVPVNATVLDAGDYGVKVVDNQPTEHSLTALALTCEAPNLMALKLEDQTILFWTLVTANFTCEDLRKNILLSAVDEAKLNDPAMLFGRKVGVRIAKLPERTDTGEYNVSIYWKDGGSALFTTFRNWKTPKQ